VTRGPFWPRRQDLPKDLSAGVTVALVSVAEGMAYALVAGVDPVYGLYAGSVSVLVGSLLASSSLLVVTATNALALVAADHIGALGDDVDPATALFTLTVLVGAVMLGLGLARLGSAVRFISAEVQAGLVAAVALLIVLGQYDELVGYSSDETALGGGKVVKAVDITANAASWDGATTTVGIACIVALVAAKRTRLRSYADIVAMVLGIALVSGLGLDSVQTVGDIASIPTGLDAIPTPHWPDFGLVPELLPAAVAAAIVGLAEASTVGAAYPNPDGARADMNRDFVAQGAANLAGGFFRALPAGGSLSRTGVNVSAGARSRWAGVSAGVLLVLLVAVVGRLAERIPMTTLAAILMVIGVEALIKEVSHLVEARWVSWPHVGAASVTVVVGVVDELTVAIFTGVALSLLLYVISTGDRAKLVSWTRRPDGSWEETPLPAELPSGQVTVLALTGSAYFASTYRADDVMPGYEHTTGAAVVLQLRDRLFYSLTGVDWLKSAVEKLHGGSNVVLLADLDPSQREALVKTGLLDTIGEDRVVWRDPVLGAAAAEAARRGQAWISAHHDDS
jgi:SulP family sulfate permease